RSTPPMAAASREDTRLIIADLPRHDALRLSPKGRYADRAGMTIPFGERGGTARGLLDLATGCYPAFLFGASLGDMLPVFHFHDVTRDWLEPRLSYLAENGYRTVVADDIERYVVDGRSPGPRAVALTFDDAWASA